jgi:hypothetical protein
MKFVKKYSYQLLFLALLPVVSLADGRNVSPCRPEDGMFCNPINQSTLDGFLAVLLEGAIKIGLPIIALAIIYSGFLFVKARGNPEELTKAKAAFLYTLIGAAILLGAWALVLLIQATVTSLGK